MNKTFSFTTDTATLSIFDLVSLKHRVSDDADWWSIPEDELEEVNKGNVLFLNLGEDGQYTVRVVDNISENYKSLFLNVPSGKVFVGAGEDTSGGDLEPDGSDYMSGVFLILDIGNYEVRFRRDSLDIVISLIKSSENKNEESALIRI
ncbi:hypothetical protein HLB02_14905 [Serratia nevei]|uniref:DUF6386 family protein n=1 Tax=Serratia TaxID=613 RepID=UPI00114E7909|nr:DUF6386 family protein [Serratia marcescens]MBL0874666.1 hypothetical protein [Serratia nevei]MBH3255204.1 hypothetical protein [Serratia marcescens]QDI18747.1 hypothetical protein FBF86_12500 [Serratia marcescens]QDI28490.1 hypothetical protein FG169_12500 [Serratia marcescens]QDI42996.1 hypothetical protein FG172_12725 [Serratia marcescens]